MRTEVETVQSLIYKTRGRWFTVEFTKKDGTARKMIARLGVHKHVTGAGLGFEPKSKGLQVVFSADAAGYRMVNLAAVTSLRCGEIDYRKA